MNLELRHALQQTEEQLLEIGGAPAGRRKDLVHHYLVNKEEELAEARRENKFLHSEIEHLRVLANRRLQPQQQKAGKGGIPPPAIAGAGRTGGGGGGGGAGGPGPAYPPISILRGPAAGGPTGPSYGPRGGAGAGVGRVMGSAGAGAGTGGVGAGAGGERYNPSRNKTVVDGPGANPFVMSKDEAKVVVLSEVRRLRDSHAMLQDSRNQLNNKVFSLPRINHTCINLPAVVCLL
jgi:hypothetical protein